MTKLTMIQPKRHIKRKTCRSY